MPTAISQHLNLYDLSLIKLTGKRAIEPSWQKYCVTTRQLPAEYIQNNNNVGIPTGPANGLIVLDIDSQAKFKALQRMSNHPVPETLTVKTSGTNTHHYYQYPDDGAYYTNRSVASGGFDIRANGGYVVAPGSIHPKTRKPYTIIIDAPIAPAPQWLLDLCRREKQDTKPSMHLPEKSDWNGNIDDLPVSDKVWAYIVEGAEKGQADRSSMIHATIIELIDAQLTEAEIFQIFDENPIGDKYREKGAAKRKWLQDEINRALQKTSPAADFTPIKQEPDKSYGFTDLRTLRQKRDNVRWLVKKFIPLDSITYVFGDSGTYKSFVVIDAGLHVATGKQWLDQKTAAGPVIYIAGEGHGGLGRRVEAWCHNHNIPEDQFVPFYVSDHAIMMDNPGAVKACVKNIEGMLGQNPACVIIDTMAANRSTEENSTTDGGAFLRLTNDLRRHFGCAVVIVHHTGHKDKHRMRGAYALHAGADAVYRMQRVKDDDYGAHLAASDKMKDAETTPDIFFDMHVISLGLDDDGDEVTSLVACYNRAYEFAKRAMENEVLTLIDAGELTQREIAAELKISEFKVARIKRQAIDQEILNSELKLTRKGLALVKPKL
jgi:RecA-family ATPase